jgi:hypothetical protein
VDVTRRGFLAAALAGGAATLVPLDLLARAAAASAAANARFFTPREYATCAAICARIVPTDADPGAAQARAVDFIDLFLAAFELPADVAENPPVYLRGRYSGRNAYPDFATGEASAAYPPSDLAGGGRRHFLTLSRLQTLSWMTRLYGPSVITQDGSLPKSFRDAVAHGLIPTPPPLRDTYRKGLAGFDSYSEARFGVPFAQASPQEQDLMLTAAGNVILSNLPLPVVSPPPEAVSLFPVVELHTFQGCFCLPEYGGNGGDPRNPLMWKWIQSDGDTQPLGNSVYDENLTDEEITSVPGYLAGGQPRQGANAGFGDPAVYQPRGGYREHREVSTNDQGSSTLSYQDIASVIDTLRSRGAFRGKRLR